MGVTYNPKRWKDCCIAYLEKQKGETIAANVDLGAMKDEYDLDVALKEAFCNEDGTYKSEAAKILVNGVNDFPTYMSLVEAINLTEFDPMTEGGEAFWKNLFECKSLAEEAENEGVAFGKWDVLRQAINMGSIAYIAKLNNAMAFIDKYGFNDLTINIIHRVFGFEYRMLVVREHNKV